MDTTPDTNNTTTPKVGSRWVNTVNKHEFVVLAVGETTAYVRYDHGALLLTRFADGTFVPVPEPLPEPKPEAWFTVDRNGDRRWHAGEEAAKASARRLGDPAIARYTLAEVIRMDGAE